MLKLAFSSVRVRLSSFGGALIAVVFAAGLVVACGVLLESAIRSDIGGTTRFEGATAMIQKRPVLQIPAEIEEVPDHPSPESPPVPAEIVNRAGQLPGV